jgi:hypothetical protein
MVQGGIMRKKQVTCSFFAAIVTFLFSHGFVFAQTMDERVSTPKEGVWETSFQWFLNLINEGFNQIKILVESAEGVFFLIFLTLIVAIIVTNLINGIRIWFWKQNRSIGPIVVEDSEQPETATAIRHWLNYCGVKCGKTTSTQSPNDDIGFDSLSTSLVSITGAKTAVNILFTLVNFVLGFIRIKPVGYGISFTLIKPDEKETNKKVQIAVDVKLLQNDVTIRSVIIEAETKDEAIKKTGYWIFWYLSGRPDSIKFISPWNRFCDFEGFYHFNLAIENRDVEQESTKKYFLSALKKEPFNARLRLEWADYLETHNHYLDALEVYLEDVLMWRHLYTVWYRIAAIFEASEVWINQWEEDKEKRKQLTELIRRLFINAKLNPNYRYGENSSKSAVDNLAIIIGNESVTKKKIAFINLEIAILAFIQNCLLNAIYLWVEQLSKNLVAKIFRNLEDSPYRAKYYWGLSNSSNNSEGRIFLKSVQLAYLCALVKLKTLKVTSPDNWTLLENQFQDMIYCFESSEQKKYGHDLSGYSFDDFQIYHLFGNIHSIFGLNNETIPKHIKYRQKSVEEFDFFQEFVKIPGTRMSTYYNAACFLTLVSEFLEKENNDKYKEKIEICRQKAMVFLRKAYEDPQTRLEFTWIQNDPDLKSLMGGHYPLADELKVKTEKRQEVPPKASEDIEFCSIFDLIPEEVKNKKELKNRGKVLRFLDQNCDMHLNAWKHLDSDKVTTEQLYEEAVYQSALWENLDKLFTTPEDNHQLKKLWHLFSQKGNVKPLEKLEFDEPLQEKEIVAAWQTLKDFSTFQMEAWKRRLERFSREGKEKSNEAEKGTARHDSISDAQQTAEIWKSKEVWQWQYLKEVILKPGVTNHVHPPKKTCDRKGRGVFVKKSGNNWVLSVHKPLQGHYH